MKIKVAGKHPPWFPSEEYYYAESTAGAATDFKGRSEPRTPRPLAGLVIMTLEQACPPEYQGAQCAFKDSMIH